MDQKKIPDNLIDICVYAKNHTDQKTIEKINSLFSKEDTIVKNESVNQAYYKYSVEDIYIKNGNGIYISIGSGAGDIFGKNYSHGEGMDISICSPFMDDAIVLFYDGENKVNGMSNFENKITNMIHVPLSVETIIDRINNYPAEKFLYNILPDEYKKNEKIIQAMIVQMEAEAKIQHQNLVDYSNISPNGGVDVVVLPQEEIFINMMKDYDYSGNELLISQIQNFVIRNYSEFISKEIQRLDKAIYIVEHENEYRHNFRIDENIDFEKSRCASEEKNLNKTLNDISALEKSIDQNQREIEKIRNKRYNLLTIFAEKKNDQNKLSRLEEQIKNSEKDILDKKDNINFSTGIIRNSGKEIEHLNSQIFKLKYPYAYVLNDGDAERFSCIYDQKDFDESMECMKSKGTDIVDKRERYKRILEEGTIENNNFIHNEKHTQETYSGNNYEEIDKSYHDEDDMEL